MADFNHNAFEKMIDNLTADQITPVYMIHGDEFLVKNIVKRLKEKLLPKSKQKTNFNPIDGAIDLIPSAIEQLNTFSLIPGIRIIAIIDSQVFYSGHDRSALLEKGQSAFSENQLKKASHYLLNLLATEKLGIEDIYAERLDETIQSLVKEQNDASQHTEWLQAVADYCVSQKLSVPDAMNYSDMLTESIEKGFAQRNILMITTDTVQKNRRLYKAILKKGTVVHCQIPKGFVKADQDQQEKTFRENAQTILSQHGKTMAPDAFSAMREMINPSLRSFSINLEKLIQYVGTRKKITKDDVEAVIEHSRQDPIFELTNALSDRNLIEALLVLENLFANQFNPLQALAAIANLIRRLLLIVDVKEMYHGSYQKGMSFAHFKNQFFQNVLEYDQRQAEDSQTGEVSSDAPKKVRGKVSKTTLMVAKNPKSIYPVYLGFKASENYHRQELIDAIQILYQADKRIKTGSQDNRRVIEQAIIQICRRKQPVRKKY
ncbi:MAG: hypothetical protein HQK75_02435 [Candidatus Magnetomorum sp.]|nr:hypothetical protein [Candidatus Magnetomorum sp.]